MKKKPKYNNVNEKTMINIDIWVDYKYESHKFTYFEVDNTHKIAKQPTNKELKHKTTGLRVLRFDTVYFDIELAYVRQCGGQHYSH